MARAAAPASGAPAMSSYPPASPAAPSLTLPRKRGREGWGWADGAADFVHDSRAALHDLSPSPPRKRGPRASDEVPELWVPAFAGTTK